MQPTIPSALPREPASSAPSIAPRTRRGEQLGETIAELASRLHAATYELLVLLREFDDTGVWSNGFRSCAHWLSWRTGVDLGAARQKVRVAHALATLPRISAAMESGELSYAKVRAIARIASPDNESQLLDIARAASAIQVEKIVRAWRRVDRVAASRLEDQRHLHRQVTTWVDDDGMVVIPAALRRALAARDSTCTFPGCTAPARYCDAHHLRHWAHGGETSLRNTTMLCRTHHRQVHEGGCAVARDPDGVLRFFRPDGRPIEIGQGEDTRRINLALHFRSSSRSVRRSVRRTSVCGSSSTGSCAPLRQA